MSSRRVFFQSLPDNLKLEGRCFLPSNTSGSVPGAIVLHPHPHFGGAMENNVVNAVCDELVSNDMIAFKFNCRGVGNSEGKLPVGTQALEDTQSALNYFETIDGLDKNRIFFIGYSWGSKTGLEAVHQDSRIKVLAAISPPIGLFAFDFLKSSTKPKVLTLGTRDQLIPRDLFDGLFESLHPPKEKVLCETDHFYMGKELEVSQKVIQFVKEYLS